MVRLYIFKIQFALELFVKEDIRAQSRELIQGPILIIKLSLGLTVKLMLCLEGRRYVNLEISKSTRQWQRALIWIGVTQWVDFDLFLNIVKIL